MEFLSFLWHLPIFLFELGLNLIFWGSWIALLTFIFKWGTERYFEIRREQKRQEVEDDIDWESGL